MIATASSPIFFLNSCRDNRIHGVCDSQIYLHKSFGEDIKEHGADFRTVFFIQ